MKKVLCVGTLIIDIINAKVDHLPKESECVMAEVSMNFGGSAFSTSVNLRRLANRDVSVTCYGPVGEDDLGDLFENRLKREDVECRIDRIKGKKTSCNMILQERERDRRYIFDEGANASASKERVLEIMSQVKPDVLVLGEIPSLGLVGADFMEIIDDAKRNCRSLVYLDLLVTAEESYGWLAGRWHQIDIIHCNYGEGAYITGKDTAPEICRWFLNNGVRLAIVSDGANGSFYGYNDKIKHISAHQSEEIDATGAGDAMTAGTIIRLLELQAGEVVDIQDIDERVIRDVLHFASACGAVAVGTIGCIGDISREKVESILNGA